MAYLITSETARWLRGQMRGRTPAATRRGRGPRDLGSAAYPWGQRWNFGLKIGSGEVTIYPGVIRSGIRLYESAETDIPLSSAGTFIIFWSFHHGTRALSVSEGSKTVADWDTHEIDDASASNGLLYELEVSEGAGEGDPTRVTLAKIWQVGLGYPQIWGPVT